jgi:hypothetical protein
MNIAKSTVRDVCARETTTTNDGNLKNNGLAPICGVIISTYKRYLPKPKGGFLSSGCLAQPAVHWFA